LATCSGPLDGLSSLVRPASCLRDRDTEIEDGGHRTVPIPASSDGDQTPTILIPVGMNSAPSPSPSREIPRGGSGIGAPLPSLALAMHSSLLLFAMTMAPSCSRGAYYLQQCFFLAFCQSGESSSVYISLTQDGFPRSHRPPGSELRPFQVGMDGRLECDAAFKEDPKLVECARSSRRQIGLR
jgi:hypothetical protein